MRRKAFQAPNLRLTVRLSRQISSIIAGVLTFI